MSINIRLDGIDFLRGIAVSSVVVYHFFVLLGLSSNKFFPYAAAIGSLGVPLFFIISGYLIYRSVHNSTVREGRSRGVLLYFLHRAFRIMPAYYFNLFFVLMMAALIHNEDFVYSLSFLAQVISNFTFTAYFFHKDSGFGFNGAYWTLNIEMLWYLLAPLMLFFFKRSWSLGVVVLLSFIYLYALGRGLLDSQLGIDPNASNYLILLHYWATQLPGQINFFIVGIIIYRYKIRVGTLPLSVSYLFSLILLGGFLFIVGHYGLSHNPLLRQMVEIFMATGLFLLLFTAKVRGVGFIDWIGKISYSLYLWHMPLLYLMRETNIFQYLSMPKVVLLFVMALFFIASLSYYLVEEGGYMIRKKFERFLPKKSIDA